MTDYGDSVSSWALNNIACRSLLGQELDCKSSLPAKDTSKAWAADPRPARTAILNPKLAQLRCQMMTNLLIEAPKFDGVASGGSSNWQETLLHKVLKGA